MLSIIIIGSVAYFIFYFYATLAFYALIFWATFIKWAFHFLKFLLNLFKKEIPINKEFTATPKELDRIIKEIKKTKPNTEIRLP